MRHLILTGFALSALMGCSALSTIATKGAEINDNSLETSEFIMCQAASVGSVKRRYDTPERARAWRELCSSSDIPLILPEKTGG